MRNRIDLAGLSFDNGAHLLVKNALLNLASDAELEVQGHAPDWLGQLETWCRTQGHTFRAEGGKAFVRSGKFDRWHGGLKTGRLNCKEAEAVQDQALPRWGLAARGALVEANSPEFHFRLDQKKDLWSENVQGLYAQAVAAQWDPDKALEWPETWPETRGLRSPPHGPELEKAIVQVMSYMVENENVALIAPARFLGELHPHYREVQALLAIQIADEARHIEVFTRRIHLYGSEPAYSTAGGQSSLQSILDEKEFSVCGFLLAVLGEGTFVDLLQFLAEISPDAITRNICRLAAIDEARHVSFGMSHLLYRLEREPEFRRRLALATQSRFERLANSDGLNGEVFDSLMVLAAGDFAPENIERGAIAVQNLLTRMETGRRVRLERLGFSDSEAQKLARLHTSNFM